ncbi:MAG: prolipoprotein diacylglyceryl transferase family protein, partial [Solirubrobacteraceae bacterium]
MSLIASIPSPPANGFYIGPLFFHAYGICYVFAVAAAIYISRRRWARVGGDPELCYEIAMWAFPAGLVGGRIYFLITTPSQVPDHWWGPFAIWTGGLGIWGGIAAGVGVGMWRARKHLSHADLMRMMDAVAPALL